MRIISLLPGATEILHALGVGDRLVGVSHACPADDTLPRLTRWRGPGDATAAEVDAAVRELLATGQSLYEFDAPQFRLLEPNLVLTQSLCNVCAVDGADVRQAAAYAGAEVWEWSPKTLADIFAGIEDLATLCDVPERGRALVASLQGQLDQLRRRHAAGLRARVAFLEWLDPLFSAGHWIPELVAVAGGDVVLGVAGEPSRQIDFPELAAADPDVIIAACCGWPARQTQSALESRLSEPCWQALEAVRAGRIHVVDAETQFTCPGPSVVRAAEELAELLGRSAHHGG